MTLLAQSAIFLAAAVVAVPLSKRLGLGSVLGYLGAGMLIGPHALDLVGDTESVLHFAEFGVVLLLFVIGLEVQPSRLWVMRTTVFGLGGAQVAVSALFMTLIGMALGLSWSTALVVGSGLSLSSTAFALQLLSERKEIATHHGRSAFGVLLFQDLAVIPLLAIMPLLPGAAAGESTTLLGTLRSIAILVAVVVGGRYLLRPVLRVVASTRMHELFTAITLLVVIGTALAMEFAGISMALGAFLAGVLLADSEYRHELEADIEPFKGLLLGLFFIAVGASVNLPLVVHEPSTVAALVAGLLVLKFAVLYGLGRVAGRNADASRRLALLLAQGGEFAFVIFNTAVQAELMTRVLADELVLAVTLSMASTPLLFLAYDAAGRRGRQGAEPRPFDEIDDDEPRVVIAGFGRFGQIIARILRAKKIRFTALDKSPEQVDFVRRFGNRVFYGDPARVD